jgi:hypothetical protein
LAKVRLSICEDVDIESDFVEVVEDVVVEDAVVEDGVVAGADVVVVYDDEVYAGVVVVNA